LSIAINCSEPAIVEDADGIAFSQVAGLGVGGVDFEALGWCGIPFSGDQ